MKLHSINVSPIKEIEHKGRSLTTGIFKEPVAGRVHLGSLNLDGDRQADLNAHGGPNRAVYVYSLENYAHWQQELGRDDFAHGQFGENFTVDGMLEDRVHVGDTFRVGSAVVQITQPRVPCQKLAIKMHSPSFIKAFLKSCRVGFYLRVIEEGDVETGDAIELVSQDLEKMTVHDICHLYYFDPNNLDACERAIRIESLSPGWRDGFEERLRKAERTE